MVSTDQVQNVAFIYLPHQYDVVPAYFLHKNFKGGWVREYITLDIQ